MDKRRIDDLTTEYALENTEPDLSASDEIMSDYSIPESENASEAELISMDYDSFQREMGSFSAGYMLNEEPTPVKSTPETVSEQALDFDMMQQEIVSYSGGYQLEETEEEPVQPEPEQQEYYAAPEEDFDYDSVRREIENGAAGYVLTPEEPEADPDEDNGVGPEESDEPDAQADSFALYGIGGNRDTEYTADEAGYIDADALRPESDAPAADYTPGGDYEIDPRFDIGGQRPVYFSYGGESIEQEADPDYIQQKQKSAEYFVNDTGSKDLVDKLRDVVSARGAALIGRLGKKNRRRSKNAPEEQEAPENLSYAPEEPDYAPEKSREETQEAEYVRPAAKAAAYSRDAAEYTRETVSEPEKSAGRRIVTGYELYETPAEETAPNPDGYYGDYLDFESLNYASYAQAFTSDYSYGMQENEAPAAVQTQQSSSAAEEPQTDIEAEEYYEGEQDNYPADGYSDSYSDGDDEEERGFGDSDEDRADYAAAADYDYSDPDGDDFDERRRELEAFPSFREYLASIAASVLYRFRSRKKESVDTVPEDDENLGPELNVQAASKYYGAYVNSMRLRLRIGAVLAVLIGWVSIGLPVPGMLQANAVAAAFCTAAQLCIMLCCLDAVTGGIMNAVRGSIGADSLAVFACILSVIDGLLAAKGKNAHLPLCALSSVSLLGVMFASMLSARALRKAIRVPAIARKAYTVTAETGVNDSGATLLKSQRPISGFVRRAEEAAPDETLYISAGPILLLAAAVLSLIACAFRHDLNDLIYNFSAILAPAVPFTALVSFALPYFMGTMGIFASGAAIAGWSGLNDIGSSKDIIVTDRDIFPEGTVSIENIRIFADESSEKVLSYAGTLIITSGSCLAQSFEDAMRRNDCAPRKVTGFEYLPGGGFKGVIDSDVVICGNVDLMRLMNVFVPTRLIGKNTVLLAINGILYGIFNIRYTGDAKVREALVKLIASNRHPIFAIRDFNVTPDMLSEVFDVATDGYDFPPYADRFRISSASPSERSKVSAVICREGLGPLTHMADVGRAMYSTTKLNIYISSAVAAAGMLISFIRLAAGSFTPGFMTMFMLFTALPVLFLSVFMRS